MLTKFDIEKLIPLNWIDLLNEELDQISFEILLSKLNNSIKTNQLLPPIEQIFKIYHHLDVKQTKVLILGQDPYHGTGQAHGLSFSIENKLKLPPSLINIFKEIKEDIGINNDSGNLMKWVKQGVFLLNSVLTVDKGLPNSHRNIGWEKITDKTIDLISNHNKHVVFMLWGSKAQKKEALIDNEKHLILKTSHPSPLSCYRGFSGCKHFSKANSYLKQFHGKEINWET